MLSFRKPHKRTRFCKETGWGNKFENKRRYDEGKFQFSRPFKVSLHPDVNVKLFPNLPPVTSNTHIFFKSYAIRLDSFLADSFFLLAAFLEGSDRSFESFKNVWIRRQFSLVHIMCNERISRERSMLVLFQLLFTFLYEDVSSKFPGISLSAFDLHIGVIFSIYMLYNTQPGCLPKSLIPIDANQWDLILKIYNGFCSENIVDGIYALGTLINEKSFVHMSFIDHRPFFYQQSRLESGGYIPGLSTSKTASNKKDSTKTRIEILNEQLDEIEASLKTSRLDNFCESGKFSDLVNLEEQYKANKNNLESNFSTFGLNDPIATTFTDRDFLNWVSSQEFCTKEESALVNYMNNIASEHSSLKEKVIYSIPRPPNPNNTISSQQNEAQPTETIFDTVSLSTVLNSPADLAFKDPNNENETPSNTLPNDLSLFSSFFSESGVNFNSTDFTKALDSLISESQYQSCMSTPQLSEQVTEYIPEQVSEQISEYTHAQISEQVTEHIPEQISERINEYIAEQISQQITEYVPEQISEQIAKYIPEQVPEQISEYIPEHITDQIHGHTNDQAIEQDSEQIPELDLADMDNPFSPFFNSK